MISISISENSAEVIAGISGLPDKVAAAMEEKFGLLINKLRDKVRDNLSGKVLNIKSGALVNALNSGVVRQGSSLIGFVEIDPPNETVKEYALAHEYGGKNSYWILVGPIGVLANKETGFFSKRDVVHPPAIERSYLRSALMEMQEEIDLGLQEIVSSSIGEL